MAWIYAVPISLSMLIHSWLPFGNSQRDQSVIQSGPPEFSNPPGVDIWCGKAYRPENASFNPGGWLDEPAQSNEPLLDLRIYPRMSIYTEDDLTLVFVVDAAISYIRGEPIGNITSNDHNSSGSHLRLKLNILVGDQSIQLREYIGLGTTSNEYSVPASYLPTTLTPYPISATVSLPNSNRTITANSTLSYLPNPSDNRSIARIDNLHGGLYARSSITSKSWTPIFPLSYYVNWGGWAANSISNLDLYASLGYNLIHFIPGGGSNPWENSTHFSFYLRRCDELGLWLMYDMRWTYQNLTLVTSQMETLLTHPSLLLWYTADEPDGYSDPLSAPLTTYNHIKSIDPYHPVSLVLNCANFHYDRYTAGADIVLADPYPVAVNTSFSTVYNTVCNATYGCCGCDNCAGSLLDVAARLDSYRSYSAWLGHAPRKALWGVPQAFGGDSFWARPPTPDEEAVMILTMINHDARGIVMWNFPTTDGIRDVTSELAKVITREEITALLLGNSTLRLELKVAGMEESGGRVDVAGWMGGNRIMVSVACVSCAGLEDTEVAIELPGELVVDPDFLFGSEGWKSHHHKLVKIGLRELETTVMIVDLVGDT
ncbi:hypothetical protein M501DRAFT_1015211 [Patellaria atrata CBS 101060]|uniref:Glycoside hydrolase subgroup catalytic core protein n=1 Tax=Patellaria atrata CBS 101060 TaxID=1346257 RepID=A0A9P4VU10_9PEZI|nr:hypothetical protein M501DRAFT_1015211 [Patellaria atrata CBS 101060]